MSHVPSLEDQPCSFCCMKSNGSLRHLQLKLKQCLKWHWCSWLSIMKKCQNSSHRGFRVKVLAHQVNLFWRLLTTAFVAMPAGGDGSWRRGETGRPISVDTQRANRVSVVSAVDATCPIGRKIFHRGSTKAYHRDCRPLALTNQPTSSHHLGVQGPLR